VLDSTKDNGGLDEGPRPKEVLLTALAGCTAMDVISILKKMQEPLKKLVVKVEGETAEEHPKYVKKIVLTYVAYGDIKEENLKRAIELSQQKYCGVSATLRPDIEKDIKWEIRHD
jgi:putative redox protein